jgi:hypothetical protein
MIRVFGWLLVPAGTLVLALGAWLAWMAWDSTSWGFADFSPQAASAAALGAVALLSGLVLLQGRPLVVVIVAVVVGVGAMALAADLFLRDAGASLFGDADGWQLGDGAGASSLAPAWALLVEGAVVAGGALWCRRSLGDSEGAWSSPTSRVSG